jgi:hypothetical protein
MISPPLWCGSDEREFHFLMRGSQLSHANCSNSSTNPDCLHGVKEPFFLSLEQMTPRKEEWIQREENERTKIHLSCAATREKRVTTSCSLQWQPTSQREGGAVSVDVFVFLKG